MKQLTLLICAVVLIIGSVLLYDSEAIKNEPVIIFTSAMLAFLLGMLCIVEIIVIEILKRDKYVRGCSRKK